MKLSVVQFSPSPWVWKTEITNSLVAVIVRINF